MFIKFPEVTGVYFNGLDRIQFPRMHRIRQRFDTSQIENIREHLRVQLDSKIDEKAWFQGKRICITVGSRGIPDLDVIVKTLCDGLQSYGAEPFIIPAMGSHGGATAEGQAEVLAGYGITEETMGVPIRASMEVMQYGSLPNGTPLYCDRIASLADGIVLLNKIKPHTDFRGEHESGLAKMIAIGIAKHKGASAFHLQGLENFPANLKFAAETFLSVMPVVFGVGLVQNAYDHICALEVARPADIMETDARLLLLAKERIARFLFPETDVLIIDEIGKQFSGFGQDPNVTGRANGDIAAFAKMFSAKRMLILDISPESHHNGCGIAEADITTRRCLNAVDWGVTWTNIATTTRIQGGRIPMYANNDHDALQLAILGCGNISSDRLHIARIRNTLALDEIEVSEGLLHSLAENKDVQPIGEYFHYSFDSEGNFADQHNERNSKG